jgi:hypothetical protein
MRNRIKQRMIRRIALGFAVAAVAAPSALAVPLEPGATNAVQAGEYGMPTAMPSDYAAIRIDRIELARLQDRGKDTGLRSLDGVENVRVEIRGSDRPVLVRGNTAPHGTTIPQQYGMPTAMPSDYAANRVDRIELARLQDRTSNDVRGLDRVENVRVEPRGLDKPVLVVNDSSFNWSDAGIGAGFAFAAILLAAAAALSIKQNGRLGQV